MLINLCNNILLQLLRSIRRSTRRNTTITTSTINIIRKKRIRSQMTRKPSFRQRISLMMRIKKFLRASSMPRVNLGQRWEPLKHYQRNMHLHLLNMMLKSFPKRTTRYSRRWPILWSKKKDQMQETVTSKMVTAVRNLSLR